MKKIVINNTIILFLSINDMISLKRNDLKEIKKKYLNEYYNCIIYNYFDILNHKSLIRDRINKLKFKNQIKINARECDIRIISNNEKNSFLNNNHIQGTDKSQIFYGAYHEDKLVSVITFDAVRGMSGGNDVGIYELSRFSIKMGCVLVGIFNRLLKKFIKEYKPNRIISFADLNLVNRNHNIYENNGFKISKNIQSDYKILIDGDNKLFHKFTYGSKFKKNQLITNEYKDTILSKSHKVWNCGKLKYELFVNNDGNLIFGFIYMIENKINGKKYVGQTTRYINKRIYEYKAAYKYNTFNNNHLGNAFNKYGWNSFEFTIIDTAITLEELNEKEIKYIQQYKSDKKEFGYNIEFGGKNAIPDTKTLEKMSKSHIGIKQTDNWINKRIAKAGSEDAKKYGKTKTNEEKEYLSQFSPKYWLGKTRDNMTKNKISETKKKNGFSDKQKEIICKKVYRVNIFDNSIKEFESTKLASMIEHVNQSTISRWCTKNKTVNGYSWHY
jgi:group I intron endonuclease